MTGKEFALRNRSNAPSALDLITLMCLFSDCYEGLR